MQKIFLIFIVITSAALFSGCSLQSVREKMSSSSAPSPQTELSVERPQVTGYIAQMRGTELNEWLIDVDEVALLSDFDSNGNTTNEATQAMIEDGVIQSEVCSSLCAPNGLYISNPDTSIKTYSVADMQINVVANSNREGMQQTFTFEEWLPVYNEAGMGKKNRDQSPYFLYPYTFILSQEDPSIIVKIEPLYLP